MITVGFNFTKNNFRYCVLENSTSPPSILDKNKIVYPNNMDVPSLMEWFETQIELIIGKYTIESIAYKLSLNLPNSAQIQQSCYPQAILNLIAKKKDIPIKSYTPQAINATKFGKSKKDNVFDYLDSQIGKHPPYWDKAMRESVLISWFNLL